MSKSPVWKGTRLKVWDRDAYKCTYCGTFCDMFDSKRRPTIDHVIPRSQGGSNRIVNLVTACASCNSTKRERTAEWLLERLAAAS